MWRHPEKNPSVVSFVRCLLSNNRAYDSSSSTLILFNYYATSPGNSSMKLRWRRPYLTGEDLYCHPPSTPRTWDSGEIGGRSRRAWPLANYNILIDRKILISQHRAIKSRFCTHKVLHKTLWDSLRSFTWFLFSSGKDLISRNSHPFRKGCAIVSNWWKRGGFIFHWIILFHDLLHTLHICTSLKKHFRGILRWSKALLHLDTMKCSSFGILLQSFTHHLISLSNSQCKRSHPL